MQLVIFIGGSGSGKSTAINCLVGRTVARTSDGEASCTKDASMYRAGRLTLVDTMGAQDTHAQQDDLETLRGMFALLNDQGTRHDVHMRVVWTTKPEDRMSPVLQDQAKFIDSLCPHHIWRSTLILCRGGQNEGELQGAVSAASRYCQDVTVARYNLTRVDLLPSGDGRLIAAKMMPPDSRIKVGWLNESDARGVLLPKIQALPTSTLRLRDERCTKCNARGDSRGFKFSCHTTPYWKHPSGTQPEFSHYHNGEYSSPVNRNPIKTGVGHLLTFGVSTGITALAGGFKASWTCCGAESSSAQGCKMAVDTHTRLCCGKAADSEGCRKVCRGCDRRWGTTTGCISCKHSPHRVVDA